MAEIDDIRAQIARAADAGDTAEVQRLSTRYRDLQATSGQLPVVGRFRAETGREFQLAQRASQLRRAGREDDAVAVIRAISRERVARQHNERSRGGFDPLSFGLGLNRSLFNVGNVVPWAAEAIEDNFGGNRNRVTAGQRVEDIQRAGEDIRAAHPISAGAGEITGVIATLPAAELAAARLTQGARAIPGARSVVAAVAPVERASVISAEARAAQLAARGGRTGQLVRGSARAAVAGGAFGGAQGASDAAALQEDVAQGAAEGAEFGAAAGVALRGVGEVVGPRIMRVLGDLGDSTTVNNIARVFGQETSDIMPTLTRRLGRAPNAAEIRQEQNARAAMRRLADQSDEAAQDVVQRYNDFRAANNGAEPTAIEVLSQRSGRQVTQRVIGHGEATERAIELSDDVMTQRPAQQADAISNGQSRVSAGVVRAERSGEFTAAMRDIGDHQVNLSDADLGTLNSRTAQALLRQPDGVLSDAGQRVADAFAQRQAAAAANAAVPEAQRIAAQALRAAQRDPNNPAARAQLQRAVTALRDARARARTAAAAVRPVHLTIREVETLRHDIRGRAREGNTFALNELGDEIRAMAMRNGGQAGRRYEMELRRFESESARADGVDAGRGVARAPTDEARAVARADATADGSRVPPQQVAPTQRGAREGVVSGLAERSAQGNQGFRATARDLSENQNLRGALDETVGPQESQRLQRIGQVNDEAAAKLEANTPSRAEAQSEEAQRLQRLLVSGATIATGNAGGAFRANFADKIINHFRISRNAALNLTELAFNPARSAEFIALLTRLSGSGNRLRQNMDFISGVLAAEGVRTGTDSKLEGERMTDQAQGTEGAAPEEAAAEPVDTAQPVSFNEISPVFLERLAQIESSGNPDATPGTSSALGLHQFIESTWIETLRQHGAELGLERIVSQLDDPSKREAILALRRDPEISSRVAAAFTAANLNALERELGREPTAGELYAAHFMGLGGARRLVQAAERGATNAAAIFPREARANRARFYRNGRPLSAQEVIEGLNNLWADDTPVSTQG